jgi:alkanesulfonate monooxygenase SsuD/methylene tetrahydromethanopterin reductase-like flavin-dependent oxidoreductase (luciferase family)
LRVRIGLNIVGRDSLSLVEAIVEAEQLGFDAAWLTSGWLSPDPLPILAAAARQTSTILLGTSIVPMLTRHPLAAAQAAMVVQELSEGRFRLGVGTTTRLVAERILAVSWPKPLSALREYVTILREILASGRVDFSGRWYSGHARLPRACQTPIFVAALNEAAWENAGRIADGAISWMAPRRYLTSHALPALQRGAAGAAREVPALVVHVPVIRAEDAARTAEAMVAQLGAYGRVAEYRSMFAAAGAPAGANGEYAEALLADLVVPVASTGLPEALAQLERAGVAEVLLSVLDGGTRVREATRDIARRLLP